MGFKAWLRFGFPDGSSVEEQAELRETTQALVEALFHTACRGVVSGEEGEFGFRRDQWEENYATFVAIPRVTEYGTKIYPKIPFFRTAFKEQRRIFETLAIKGTKEAKGSVWSSTEAAAMMKSLGRESPRNWIDHAIQQWVNYERVPLFRMMDNSPTRRYESLARHYRPETLHKFLENTIEVPFYRMRPEDAFNVLELIYLLARADEVQSDREVW